MTKKKRQGHYCKICGEIKANEKFSGKGHAAHICKECNALPQEKKNELQILKNFESHCEYRRKIPPFKSRLGVAWKIRKQH